jgi:hypothetical protein
MFNYFLTAVLLIFKGDEKKVKETGANVSKLVYDYMVTQ